MVAAMGAIINQTKVIISNIAGNIFGNLLPETRICMLK